MRRAENCLISVGVSEKRKQHMSLEQALHLADEDMYVSKHSSRHYSGSSDYLVQS